MKIGKKLIAGAMLSCGAAFSFSEVQAQTCVVPPSCEKLGYSMSVTDCDGQRYIRCPLDVDNDNAVYCSKACSCPSGFSPYNTCTGAYSRTASGECGNTCYQCWDGIFTVELLFYCNYNSSGELEVVSSPSFTSDWVCRNILGQTLPVHLPISIPDYTEEELRAICPAAGQPGRTLVLDRSTRGYCNVEGNFYMPWPGK